MKKSKTPTKISELVPDGFKPISNLDNFYYVNNSGCVISLKGRAIRIIKQYIAPNGYVKINVTHNSRNVNLLVHRLVASAFIDNPNGKETVNHKDGNKENNHAVNLEWATVLENNQHARTAGLSVGVPHSDSTKQNLSNIHKERARRFLNSNAKPIKDNVTGEVYKTAKDAAKSLGYNYSHFIEMLKGSATNKTNCTYA